MEGVEAAGQSRRGAGNTQPPSPLLGRRRGVDGAESMKALESRVECSDELVVDEAPALECRRRSR